MSDPVREPVRNPVRNPVGDSVGNPVRDASDGISSSETDLSDGSGRTMMMAVSDPEGAVHPRMNLSLILTPEIDDIITKEIGTGLFSSRSDVIQTSLARYFGKTAALSELFPGTEAAGLRKPAPECSMISDDRTIRTTVSVSRHIYRKLRRLADRSGISLPAAVSAILYERLMPEKLSGEYYRGKEEPYIEIPAGNVDEFVISYVHDLISRSDAPGKRKR